MNEATFVGSVFEWFQLNFFV